MKKMTVQVEEIKRTLLTIEVEAKDRDDMINKVACGEGVVVDRDEMGYEHENLRKI